MKTIQMKISKLFAVEVEDNIKTDDFETLHNALAEEIAKNNETEKNIFYESLEVVCCKCGCDLNLDEEKETGICVSCEGLKNE